jgi:hypothetical protein
MLLRPYLMDQDTVVLVDVVLVLRLDDRRHDDGTEETESGAGQAKKERDE